MKSKQKKSHMLFSSLLPCSLFRRPASASSTDFELDLQSQPKSQVQVKAIEVLLS
jgi:hypothetical protein